MDIIVPDVNQPIRRTRSQLVEETHAITPGYVEIFGAYPKSESLQEIVGRYSVEQWLLFLCRLQTLIAPPNGGRSDVNDHLLAGVFSVALKERVGSWIESLNERATIFVVNEHQLATLQQYALIYAPDSGERKFCDEGSFNDFGMALLITNSLMFPPDDGVSDMDAMLMQLHARPTWGMAEEFMARAYALYQIDKDRPSASALAFRQYFRDASGVELEDYVMGGFTVAIREIQRSPDELKKGWESLPSPEQCQNEIEGRCLDAYYRVRSRKLGILCSEVRASDDARRSVSDYSLIPLARSPVVRMPSGGFYTTSLTAVGTSLFAGVYHAVMDAVQAGRISGLNRQRLGSLLGDMFEEYVLGLLESVFGDRLIRLERVDHAPRADALVLYPNRVLVVEIKGRLNRATIHRQRLGVDDRLSQLEKLGLSKADRQIAQTICDLRAFRIENPLIPNYEWTNIRVTPVLITLERLPLGWNLWRHVESLTPRLLGLDMQHEVDRLRCISIDEVERFPDIGNSFEIGRELGRWSHDAATFEVPWGVHLGINGVAYDNRQWIGRLHTTLGALVTHLGLSGLPGVPGIPGVPPM